MSKLMMLSLCWLWCLTSSRHRAPCLLALLVVEFDEVVAVLFMVQDELEVVGFVLVLVSVADEVVVVEVVIAVLLLVK